MGNGYKVDVEELRAHANNLEAFKQRFDAVMSASSHITRDDEAYGTLCGWIAGCLEDRHQRQDSLVAFAADNLGLAAQAIRQCADDYEASDEESQGAFAELEGRIGN